MHMGLCWVEDAGYMLTRWIVTKSPPKFCISSSTDYLNFCLCRERYQEVWRVPGNYLKKNPHLKTHWLMLEREEWRERRRRRGTSMWERSINQVPLLRAQTRDLGMRPGQEQNWWPFGLQDDIPANWSTPARAQLLLSKQLKLKVMRPVFKEHNVSSLIDPHKEWNVLMNQVF